ncbi:hypothetical protein GE061_020259 [Apolygus lucorum]|uniref:Uncharacterized protein n=1 Tax=Apolygus lucorum TaxID=248454 RepID=A0A8S9WPM1_APOLU|nr:hypothetical protein GE061_020259 [Apolygus lucorum]
MEGISRDFRKPCSTDSVPSRKGDGKHKCTKCVRFKNTPKIYRIVTRIPKLPSKTQHVFERTTDKPKKTAKIVHLQPTPNKSINEPIGDQVQPISNKPTNKPNSVQVQPNLSKPQQPISGKIGAESYSNTYSRIQSLWVNSKFEDEDLILEPDQSESPDKIVLYNRGLLKY